MKNLFIKLLLIVILLSVSVKPALAVEMPSFPVCSNPQGTVKVAYESGIHGVPGDSNTYSGKDVVYSINPDLSTQCLCTVNGGGIQTNWWKVSSLDPEQKQILINQGWILIPDGSAWGLEKGEYLAKNISYSCGSTTTNTGTGGGDGLGCATHSCNTTTQSVLGSMTKAVLGLANTGNAMFIALVLLSGFALLTSGVVISNKKNK